LCRDCAPHVRRRGEPVESGRRRADVFQIGEQVAARRTPAAVRIDLRVPLEVERAVHRVAEPVIALFARHTDAVRSARSLSRAL